MSNRRGSKLWLALATAATALLLGIGLSASSADARTPSNETIGRLVGWQEATTGEGSYGISSLESSVPLTTPTATHTSTPTYTPTGTQVSTMVVTPTGTYTCCSGLTATGGGMCLPTYGYYYSFAVTNPCAAATTGTFYVSLEVSQYRAGPWSYYLGIPAFVSTLQPGSNSLNGQTAWYVLPQQDNFFRFSLYAVAQDGCWSLNAVTDAYDICRDFPTFTFTPSATFSPTYTPSPTVVCTPGIGYVNILDSLFNPQHITVPEGSTVYWTNRGATTHSVSSDDGLFDSGPIAPGNVYAHQFFGAGNTYAYHCLIDPEMTGSVTVVEACGRPSKTPTNTNTPTPVVTGTPTCCSITGTGSSLCLPTLYYYYGFDVSNMCTVSVTGTFTPSMEVAATASGPWASFLTGTGEIRTLQPGTSVISGNFYVASVPQAYNYYRMRLLGVDAEECWTLDIATTPQAVCREATPTITRSPTYTPTDTPTGTPPTFTRTATPTAFCSVCNVYISDIDIGCSRDGSVKWTTVLRNNAKCTITNLAWEDELQIQRNWGPFVTVATQTGTMDVPRGRSTVRGSYCSTFPPDTTQVRHLFRFVTAESGCNIMRQSPGISPCRGCDSIGPTGKP